MKNRARAILRTLVSVAMAAVLILAAGLPLAAYTEKNGYVVHNERKVFNEAQLRDAIRRANTGETILLRSAIHIDEPLIISDKNITITGDPIKWRGSEFTDDSIFVVQRGSTLTLKQIVVDGADKAGIAYVYSAGKLVIQDGAMLKNGYAPKAGGGVYNKGNLTMEGGTILECSSDEGGAVYNIGAFVMEAGTLTDNRAENGNGGGLYNDGTFAMSSGQISKNTAENGLGAGVYHSAQAKRFELGNAPVISDGVYLCKKQTITISAARLDEGANVRIEGVQDAEPDRIIAIGAHDNDLRGFSRSKDFPWGLTQRGNHILLKYYD